MSTILTSTLADLTAAKLIAYYPAPAPLAGPLQVPSTDPAVYAADTSYLMLLNEQAYWKYGVDVPNVQIANNYAGACTRWEQTLDPLTGQKSPTLPAPPSYLVFDEAAFGQWWAQYCSNPGQDAPPLFFIKPAPLPPAPVILAPGAPPPPATVPSIDGPIGPAVPNNPGVFTPSSADNNSTYPDGYIYAGPTGIYQKHIYNNPFTTGNVRIIWIALTPAIPVPQPAPAPEVPALQIQKTPQAA